MGEALGAVSHKRLEGKVAIITGGASGIGEATVHLFHENGAKVIIADMKDEIGQEIANKLGKNVTYVHCDVSNEDHIINLIDSTVEKYGKLDIMYNNAGVMDQSYGSILDAQKSDLDRLLKVNLGGAFLGAKHAARAMVPQQKGCILFTASVASAIGGVSTSSYAASKYGIVGLAKNLAAELGEFGIRVNCVSPYGVATGMTTTNNEAYKAQFEGFLAKSGNLKGEVLRVDGVAKAALFLASDEAYYVSGMNLVVDGGFSIVNPSILKNMVQ